MSKTTNTRHAIKVFIITPVRNITPHWKQALDHYVATLQQQGMLVYYPPRHTPQQDPTGLSICHCNRAAITSADQVHVAWDQNSTGCLFDLGMAFALDKPITLIPNFFPPPTPHKSFPSMVHQWAKQGPEVPSP